MFYLALIGIICALLAMGDYAISLFFYVLYRYDGGRKSFRWYCDFMKHTTIEW